MGSRGHKRKALSKKQRLEVYNKFTGHCAYCGCELEYKDMQVDHIIPKYWNTLPEGYRNENSLEESTDTLENYYPSCRMCNFYKGAESMDGFKNMAEVAKEYMPF